MELRNTGAYMLFIEQTRDICQRLVMDLDNVDRGSADLDNGDLEKKDIDQAYWAGEFHKVKGGAGFFGLLNVESGAAGIEKLFLNKQSDSGSLREYLNTIEQELISESD